MSNCEEAHWRVFADSSVLAAELVQAILAEAEECIAARGRFMLVLAGGTTPELVYRKLALAKADWPRWHIWFGDERCYPFGHADRNDTMARNALLHQVSIPQDNIHPMSGGGWGPEAGARRYAQVLPHGKFDLTLLGLGEDGHTASLFPGHNWGEDPSSPDVIAVLDSPKLPSERLSLSAKRLGQSRRVIFIVTGAGKSDAVSAWKKGAMIPASSIHAPILEVWLDRAAAGQSLDWSA